jgi:hypothetical protein
MLAVLVFCSSTASIGGFAVIADIAAPPCATKQPLLCVEALLRAAWLVCLSSLLPAAC